MIGEGGRGAVGRPSSSTSGGGLAVSGGGEVEASGGWMNVPVAEVRLVASGKVSTSFVEDCEACDISDDWRECALQNWRKLKGN